MNEEALQLKLLKVAPKLHFLTSRRLTQMLVNNAHDLIAIHKLPDLSYEYFNRAALELLGYSQEELLAQSPRDLVHPDDLERVMRKINAKIGKGDLQVEFRCRKKDGTYLWVEAQGTFFRRENDETVMVSITRDITQRKLLEEEKAVESEEEKKLHISELPYRRVVEDQTELIGRCNPDLTMTYVNRALCRAFGRKAKSIIGRSVLDLFSAERHNDLRQFLSTFTPNNPVNNFINPVENPDGTLIWHEWTARAIFSDSGEILEYQGVARDITKHKKLEAELRKAYSALDDKVSERTLELKQLNLKLNEIIERQKETEIALRDSESYYRALFENSATATVLIDQDFKIVKVNSKMSEISGVSPWEMIGSSPYDFILPEDITMVQENYRLRQTEPAKAPSSYKVRLINYRGEIRVCILYVSTIPEKQWQMVSILDATAHYQNVMKLETSEKKAQELNERYALLSTNSRDMILYYRLSDGRIIEANQAAVNEYGYSRDELLHMNIFTLRKKEEHQLAEKQMEKAAKDGFLFVAEHVRKDGSSFAAEVSSQGAMLNGENVLLSIVRNITERVLAEEMIQHQIQAQTLLLEISKKFTNAAVEDTDKIIDSTLQMLGEFYEGDRCYVFLKSEDGSDISNTHEWCAEDIRAEIANLQNLPVEVFPWWMDMLNRDEIICVPDVAEMPVEAASEQEMLKAQDIKSLLAVALLDEGNPIGFIGFDSVKQSRVWTEETIHVMEHVALIISKAVQRKKVHIALKESENYYRTLFNNTGAATIILDEDMSILKSNREWRNLLGYSEEELEGLKWPALVDATMVDRMKKYHEMRRADPSSAPHVYMSRLRDKNNKVREGLFYVSLIPDTNRSTATFIDLTDYKRIDSALKVICDGNRSILQATNEQDLLEGICKKIVAAGGYEMAWVGYIQDDSTGILKPVAEDGKHRSHLHKLNLTLKDKKLKLGPSSRAIFTKQPVVVKDIEKEEIYTSWVEYALRQGFRSTMSIPLMADDKVLGVIGIYSNSVDSFEKEEQVMLVEIANNLTYAIYALRTRNERDNSLRQLEESLHKMERILMQAVNALGTAIEIRDPYTAGHQKKVAHLASAIAAAWREHAGREHAGRAYTGMRAYARRAHPIVRTQKKLKPFSVLAFRITCLRLLL